jgi:haloacetate dehalogenase
MAALMSGLGHQRFFVAGPRPRRPGGASARARPRERIERLALIDIVPTLDMYELVDMRAAIGYYHWFFLIQPRRCRSG